MKKVLVIGANGRVGGKLVQALEEKKYTVLAGARNKVKDITGTHVQFEAIDLLSDVDTLAKSMRGVDAIYFVAGSRGKNLLQIDLHGAVKTMQAAQQARVKRYIILSSNFALQPERWNEASLVNLTNYNIAKHYADHWLVNNSGLDYTSLQPGVLLETQGSGKISVNIENAGENSIDNVVETLVAILEDDSTIGKVVMMHDGDTPIREALKQV